MRTPSATCALLVSAIALAAAAQVPQPPPRLDATVRSVRKMIEEGRATEALEALRAADATAAGTRGQARIAFYEARAYQALGDRGKALAAYERAVLTEPAYGAALNNLAVLLSQNGDHLRAAALLKNAVALDDDPRRPLYLDNYAAAAEKAGDVGEARRAWGELAAAQPGNVDAQLQSIRLLDDPGRMALRLNKLSARGEVSAAQSLALDLLGKPFDAAGKRALLGVVAGALAAQHVGPQDFASGPVSARLETLRGDPLIADGIAEIVLLYRGTVDPARYRWWRSPRDERFGALIRDMGATFAAADKKETAEGYFKLALDYGEGGDPVAFVELADLYFSRNRIADLDALTRQYERPMFAAKMDRIAEGDYAGEYRFHVALGTMYAYLERWGSDREPASAIYQLTQAGRAAADHNRTAKWAPRIPTDPKTIELLATAYEKSTDADRAMSVRVDAAAAFVAEGRKTAATALLKPIKADPSVITDSGVRERYAAVTEKLAKPIVVDFTIEFPDSVEVAITSVGAISGSVPPAVGQQIAGLIAKYVQAETDKDRDRAEDTLRRLGVSDLDPTTMSRATGEFFVEVGGKPVRYRYSVRSR